jgi:hypothetical protein
MKPVFEKIRRWLGEAWKALPKFLLAALKTKTGKTILAGIIVAACKAVGINAPFEAVSDALAQLGAGVVSPDTVFVAITGILGAHGTLNANEKREDWRKNAMPNRYYPQPDDELSLRMSAIDGEPRAVKAWELDVKTGLLHAVSTDNRRSAHSYAALPTDTLRALYVQLAEGSL